MGSSAVFAGQIQTHLTHHAAAATPRFHLRCVELMKNVSSSVVNFFFFFSPYTTELFFFLASSVSGVATSQGCSSKHSLLPFFFFFFFCFPVELWKSREKHLPDLERAFCWGWVTDTIRWIWKWYADATHRVSGVKTHLFMMHLEQNKFITGGVWRKYKSAKKTHILAVCIDMTPDTFFFRGKALLSRQNYVSHTPPCLFCQDYFLVYLCYWQTMNKNPGGR